ncbi:transcriptional regulator [Sphingobacterium mizutaii NBRC 14946 = DSM 11724]|uniref:Multiple antibiotic resistance protein marR n=3 Tax=Sphingobacterium mizutaii TaxID=1010 RepID=A0AAJ4XF30_9SPHI|nr:MarR family transcriptional regulator [Sphingobacterium mizutaii]GEM67213.1 transcriptional regulator [Sphingobacterium mizutaii NBRC 14946 = DSM 11724]SDL28566.1 DNA-binding transcriptional regulator, MarR family [Sphingobacterium mizutaii]SNV53818.1 Multiple antibiotic resistance protein marR [Sphingobacterium mizutaii]
MLKEKFNQYSFILDRTARRVKQFAQASFSVHGIDLTVDQWSVIKTLYEHQDLTHKDLSEKCGKDQPTMTRIVDLLLKKGYVQRIVHPNDRRSLHIQLTEAGQKQAKSLAPLVKDFRMKAWENLTEEDFENFTRILNTIYNNLETK